MKRLIRLPYSAIGHLATALAQVVPASDYKIARAVRARRGVLARFAKWGQDGRDPARPLLWFHAPSVGEGLQALPVLDLFRQRRPDVQLAFTFFSPSAERFSQTIPADFVDYLPFDTVSAAESAIASLRPNAIVFSKLDVWPLLTERAAASGIRLGMISATMDHTSARRSRIAGRLLGDAYALLDRVGAIDEGDAERLIKAGVRTGSITVTGDTRYDQVWERAGTAGGLPLVESLRSGRPTLVAGSTWPADEASLLPAWLGLRAKVPTARLIIAPHEPTPGSLGGIEAWARSAGLSLARVGETGAAGRDVILVDEMGVLGDLYSLAKVAFVGGGFHAAGLHSVIEPAAFGAPVLFGAPFGHTRDARLLSQTGGGRACRDSGDIEAALGEWLGPPVTPAASLLARQTIEAGRGAAGRSFNLVAGLL